MPERKLAIKRDIIKHLYFSGPLTCADLSKRLERSVPLISEILEEVMAEGYAVETGLAPSTGGRRPLMYSLKQDINYVVSVAMDQFVTRIGIMDMRNQLVGEVEKFMLPLSGNRKAAGLLADNIADVIRRSGIDRSQIIGVGVGMPGFVDPLNGINYTFLEVPSGSISRFLETSLGLPVFIDNDSSLIALAEWRFGLAVQTKSAMVINIGWGIGLGLIINQELYRGENGFAGEFSHLPLFSNEKLCSCGKKGCLETESSLLVVWQKALSGIRAGRSTLLKDLDPEQCETFMEGLLLAASRGDQFSVELLSEAGYNIGRGIAVLIHLLNPELIILSGRGANPGKFWQTPIQQALNEYCIPRLSAGTTIKISKLGYQAELIGAAALVMENVSSIKTQQISP